MNFADDAGALTSMQAVLLAKKGDESTTRVKIRDAASRRQNSIHFHHTAYNIGLAYALLAEAVSAVAWLRTAADQGCLSRSRHSNPVTELSASA